MSLKITAILLAAGESRRTGRDYKLLFEFKSNPLVRHVLEELLNSDISECIVITGCQYKLVERAIDGFGVKMIHNTGFSSGMTSSIKTGIQNISPDSHAFMVCLGDMPQLRFFHYNALIKKFNEEYVKSNSLILRPVYKEQKGHPVIFSRNYAEEVLQSKQKEGCSEILKNNKEHLLEYSLANQAYYTDIDTIKDYYKLRE